MTTEHVNFKKFMNRKDTLLNHMNLITDSNYKHKYMNDYKQLERCVNRQDCVGNTGYINNLLFNLDMYYFKTMLTEQNIASLDCYYNIILPTKLHDKNDYVIANGFGGDENTRRKLCSEFHSIYAKNGMPLFRNIKKFNMSITYIPSLMDDHNKKYDTMRGFVVTNINPYE